MMEEELMGTGAKGHWHHMLERAIISRGKIERWRSKIKFVLPPGSTTNAWKLKTISFLKAEHCFSCSNSLKLTDCPGNSLFLHHFTLGFRLLHRKTFSYMVRISVIQEVSDKL